MSKQIFFYGAMSASKSAQLLMQDYNYTEQGLVTMLIKPEIDNRDGEFNISSRIGLSSKADYIINQDETPDVIKKHLKSDVLTYPDVILVDEAQFLTLLQVKTISNFALNNKIELHGFGLLKDFQNNLFEGSRAWLETSDNIVEIKTTCSKCTRKATCNLRLNDGEPVYDGDVVQIGGNESYVSVCREHYYDYGD